MYSLVYQKTFKNSFSCGSTRSAPPRVGGGPWLRACGQLSPARPGIASGEARKTRGPDASDDPRAGRSRSTWETGAEEVLS